MRIAIVSDRAEQIEMLRRAIESAATHEVCWTAASGPQAIGKCACEVPELILLDALMPGFDSVRTTGEIMRRFPCAILLVAPATPAAEAKVFEAMGCGALDVAPAPTADAGGGRANAAELLRKVSTIARLVGKEPAKPAPPPRPKITTEPPPLIAIGSSTGGPKALASVLASLPSPLDASVVVVQHLDRQFAGGLAEWLAEKARAPVRVVFEGESPQPGIVLVAATNDHLELGPDRTLRYTAEPAGYPYRPSVDTFFLSLAKHWPCRGVAILLTGMGRDGARGLLALRQAGWHTIAQDEASSVVYGMPKAAVEMGAAVEVLPLDRIGTAAIRHAGR